MNKTLLLLGIAFFGLLGCQPPSAPFFWGEYSHTLYDYKKNPSDTTLSVHKTALLDIMKKAPEKKKLIPPGVYAEYGYILLKEGREAEGMEYLAKEEQAFPESVVFIKRIKDEYSRGKK
jgi:hypothetical protein